MAKPVPLSALPVAVPQGGIPQAQLMPPLVQATDTAVLSQGDRELPWHSVPEPPADHRPTGKRRRAAPAVSTSAEAIVRAAAAAAKEAGVASSSVRRAIATPVFAGSATVNCLADPPQRLRSGIVRVSRAPPCPPPRLRSHRYGAHQRWRSERDNANHRANRGRALVRMAQP